MNSHQDSTPPTPGSDPQITLRGPAELVDALPYVLGFHPTDSVVLVALHGDTGRFGGRIRLGIPASPREWPPVAEQLASCLIEGSARRGERPDGVIVYLCQDPVEGDTGSQVMERLRPFAQRLRTACGALDVPVREALCLSDGRFWSYCCPDARCCPPEGAPAPLPGTSVMAAAATFAGIRVQGSLREMEARLSPWQGDAAARQERALDDAAAALLPRILGEAAGPGAGRAGVAAETVRLAHTLMARLAAVPVPVPGTPGATDVAAADRTDDGLIADPEAASLVLGLQDRETRDRAAAWMEGEEAGPALRLWRALARRCVGSYAEHAAAPLALAGWVAWSSGDEPGARVALGRALDLDPRYTFARLLHQACNEGLDPEALRACLRAAGGGRRESAPAVRGGGRGSASAGGRRAGRRPRIRAARTSATVGGRAAALPGRRSGRSRR